MGALVACIPKKQGGGGAVTGTADAASSPEGQACGPDGVIDDAEDGNNKAAANKGRGGYWYTFLDKAGSTVTPTAGSPFEMAVGGANGSTHSAHFQGKIGSGDIVYGGIGVNFVDPRAPYDASAFGGISFWAKRGAKSTGRVRLKVPDANTDPTGKVCTECFNDFGIDLEVPETWTHYVVTFSSITQLDGWGVPRPAAIERAKIFGLQWQVNVPGEEYDIWIDDVQFTGCK